MNPPSISIIVPCYNQGQYLAEALNSVVAQTHTDWECIIINDNSPDDTANVAANYLERDNRFKYIVTEHKGVSFARNEGIKIANGEYILPLDADDKIAPDYLEKALAAFFENQDLVLVYGEAEFFGDAAGRWLLPEYNFYNLLFINMIYCSAIFRKKDFIVAGGYSEEMVHGLEDWDLWLRLLNDDAKVMRLPNVVFYYRRKKNSRTTELMKEQRLEKTVMQLISRNSVVYQQNLYSIIRELENTKLEKNELKRQLNLLKNSRLNRVFNILRSLRKSRLLR